MLAVRALIAVLLISFCCDASSSDNIKLKFNNQKDVDSSVALLHEEQLPNHDGQVPILDNFDFLGLGLHEPTFSPSTEPTAVPTFGSFSMAFSGNDFSDVPYNPTPSAEPTGNMCLFEIRIPM